MKLIVRPEAQAEIDEATDFLHEKSPGSVERFFDELTAARRLLVEFPNSGAPIARSRGVRKLRLNLFPYNLIYRVEDDSLVVYAVAHHKRRPRYWRNRTTS